MQMSSVKLVGLIGVMAVVAACSAADPLVPVNGALPLGDWGGDSAAMMVSDTAMHMHINCTYGDVSGSIQVVNGVFDVTGRYMLRAYPIAYGPEVPARFTGYVAGTTATSTVTVNDTVMHQTVVRGPATVTLGQTPRAIPCPVCRRPTITRPLGWIPYLFEKIKL